MQKAGKNYRLRLFMPPAWRRHRRVAIQKLMHCQALRWGAAVGTLFA